MVGAEPCLINSREPWRGEKPAVKSQESMRTIKATAVESYGEGNKRRHGIPGQKAGWRGTLGCGRGR